MTNRSLRCSLALSVLLGGVGDGEVCEENELAVIFNWFQDCSVRFDSSKAMLVGNALGLR